MELSNLFFVRNGPFLPAKGAADGVAGQPRPDRETVLLVTTGGAGRYQSLDGTAAFAPGCAVLIQSGKPSLVTPGADTEAWEISYRWEFISDLMPPDYRERHGGVLRPEPEAFRQMLALAAMLATEQHKAAPTPRYLRFLLAALLEQLHFQDPRLASLEGFSPGYMSEFQKVLSVMEAHYREPHAIRFYAQQLGISCKRLNALCTAVAGKPCSMLLEDRRMEEAKNLLISTRVSIAEISDSLGYTDQAYFSRVFRKKFGMTPSAYREEYKILNIFAE